MKKFNFKKLISVLLFVLIAIFIFYYIKSNWNDFINIHVVSWWSLVASTLLALISFWLTALFFQKSVEPYNLVLSFKEYFGLTMITLMGNYFIPFSGLGFRAIYMKKTYLFSYRNFLITVIANWVTNFLIYALAGILALAVYYYKTRQLNLSLSIIFLTILLISCLSFIPFKINSRNKFLSRIISLIVGWQEFLTHKNIIEKLFRITFWQLIVSTLMFYFAYLTFGFKVTVIESFLPTALSLYSSVIRLVPASLGLYELAVVYPSKVMGLSVAQGLLVSLITRVVTIFWTFALGLIFSYILIKPKGKEKEI